MMSSMSRTTKTALILPVALVVLTMLPITAVSSVAGFALLAYLPGRFLLPWLGIASHWSVGGRTVLAVAVSWAIVPFFLNPIWHITNDRWTILAVAWAVVTALGCFRPSGATAHSAGRFFENRSTMVLAAGVSLFLAGGVILSYYPTELFGYPVAAEIHDFIKHHAILDSLERRPLPIGNVFYSEGAEGPVYYYHFFYLVPATVRLWTGGSLSFELAFGLSGALVAVSITGVVYATAKRFFGSEASAALSAALMTAVGSFDVFLNLPAMIERGRPLVMVDHWAHHPYIVHNTAFQMIWSPQNVLAALGVLVGVYLLSTGGIRRGWLIWGPVLGAGILGSSVWVAMGALPALVIWALLRRKRLWRTVCVGLLMVAVSIPQLMGYAESGRHPERGLTTEWPANAASSLGRLVSPGITANLLDLPVSLSLEFGAKFLLLLLVPGVFWRKMWRDDGLRCLCIAAVLAMIMGSVMRVELEHNDLRHKMLLVTIVFAAILAGGAAAPEPTSKRWWNPCGWRPASSRGKLLSSAFMAILIASGLATELYEVPLTATRRYVEEYLMTRAAGPLERTVLDAEREALGFMRYQLDDDAVVQAEGTPERARLAQLIRKQIGVMEAWDDVAVFAPPDRARYDERVDELLDVLRTESSASHTHAVLRRFGVTHVFVGRIEKNNWEHLDRFDDDALFADVFHRKGIRVVQVVAEVSR